MKHSFSRLSRFIACRLAYKLEYLDKVPAEKSHPMILGGLCHDFFEAYDNHLAAAWLQTDHAAAERIMSEVFKKFERVPPPEIYEKYQAICRAFVMNHVLNLETFLGAEVKIAITRAFTLCDWEADDAWFRFKLDRLDLASDRALITDYKTGWGGESDPFQMLAYACAVWIHHEHEPLRPGAGPLNAIEVVLSYCRSGRDNKWVFSPDQVQAGFQKIVDYAERVEAEKDWKPSPGTACKGCPYAGTAHCPVKIGNMAPIIDEPTAARAAAELLLLEGQVKQRKAAIKGWCTDNGPLVAQGDVFDYGSRERYRVLNPLEFVQVLAANGYQPTEFYDVDTTELKRRCQADKNLADLLAPFIAVETGEIFSHRRAAKRDPFSLSPQGDEHEPKEAELPVPGGTPGDPAGAPSHRPGLARFGGAADPGTGDRPPAPGAGVPAPHGRPGRRRQAGRPGPGGEDVGQEPRDPKRRGPGGGRRRPF